MFKLLVFMSLCFIGCGGHFGDHWKKDSDTSKLSVIGQENSFKVSGQYSKEVVYNYPKMLLGWDNYFEYADDSKQVKDSRTDSLIIHKLESMNLNHSMSSSNQLIYEQALGWDMGEIVKAMTICGYNDNTCRCASFEEFTMFNTHPTRPQIVSNLLAILMTSEFPENADPEKYSTENCYDSKEKS